MVMRMPLPWTFVESYGYFYDKVMFFQDDNPASNPQIPWRMLIGIIAAAEPAQMHRKDVVAWNLGKVIERAGKKGRYTRGLHQHDHMEICLALAGCGIMDISTQRYQLPAPAMVIMPPGVLHSEGYFQLRQGYTTVWMNMPRWDELVLFAAQYQPGPGWWQPWRLVCPVSGNLLWTCWNGMPDRNRQAWLTDLQAALLETISTAYARHCHHLNVSDSQPNDAPPAGHAHVLMWLRRYLDQHTGQAIRVPDVAAMTRYSPNYLNTLFTRWTGLSIIRYHTQQRLTRARELLESQLPIAQVAKTTGYDDPFHFSRAFRRFFGISPSESRRRGSAYRDAASRQ